MITIYERHSEVKLRVQRQETYLFEGQGRLFKEVTIKLGAK